MLDFCVQAQFKLALRRSYQEKERAIAHLRKEHAIQLAQLLM